MSQIPEGFEQSVSEQAHQGLAVPRLQRMEGALAGEAAVADQDVETGLPLLKVARDRDRSDDPRPHVFAEAVAHVRAESGRALC